MTRSWPLAPHKQSAASWLLARLSKRLLCAQCEHRGLVFVPSHGPQQKLGEVFYDRDSSHILGVKLGGLAGEAPSDMLVACLQLACQNPL